jgi:hypothetical protein
MQLSNERLTTVPGSDTGDVNELTRISQRAAKITDRSRHDGPFHKAVAMSCSAIERDIGRQRMSALIRDAIVESGAIRRSTP